MIISFATQKGGTGKTTLAIAFANYFAKDLDKEIFVYDYDYQRSFYHRWEEDNDLTSEPKIYDVELIGEDNEAMLYDPQTIADMQDSEAIYLFDLAGKLDKMYAPLLQHSNAIVVPYNYSDVTCQSTLVFLNFCIYLKSASKLIFVRNGVDRNGNYLNQKPMDFELEKYGTVLKNSIYKRNCLQTINTRKLTPDQRIAVRQTFNELLEVLENPLAKGIDYESLIAQGVINSEY